MPGIEPDPGCKVVALIKPSDRPMGDHPASSLISVSPASIPDLTRRGKVLPAGDETLKFIRLEVGQIPGFVSVCRGTRSQTAPSSPPINALWTAPISLWLNQPPHAYKFVAVSPASRLDRWRRSLLGWLFSAATLPAGHAQFSALLLAELGSC